MFSFHSFDTIDPFCILLLKCPSTFKNPIIQHGSLKKKKLFWDLPKMVIQPHSRSSNLTKVQALLIRLLMRGGRTKLFEQLRLGQSSVCDQSILGSKWERREQYKRKFPKLLQEKKWECVKGGATTHVDECWFSTCAPNVMLILHKWIRPNP